MIDILKQDFNMSYRKVTKLAPQQNSTQNICLRAVWAKEYLSLLQRQKSRVINIDESLLNQGEYYNRIWADKRNPASVKMKSINPRISLIMALDSDGNIYSCVTQVNTTSTVMKYYLQYLTDILEREDKNFRRNTIILVDGARYHQSQALLEEVKRLALPFMI